MAKKITITFLIFILTRVSIHTQTIYSSNLKTDGILLSSGFFTFIATSIIDKSSLPSNIDEIELLSPLSINRFDRSAVNKYSKSLALCSDALVGISGVSPLLLLSQKNIRNSSGTFSLMYIETILLSVLVPNFFKSCFERYRPLVYNQEVPIVERINVSARHSFFSGHATSAFASAIFLSTVYSNTNESSNKKIFVWTGSLLLSSVICYLRYESGSHFPTDIIAGIIVGTAIGYLVPAVHH